MSAPVRIMILALALVGTALPLAAQTPPAPIVKVEGLRQISAHVHIIPDNSVPLVPNIGYVVGDRAVLVIDTGLGPRNGAAVYEVAKKLAGTDTALRRRTQDRGKERNGQGSNARTRSSPLRR